MAIHWEGVQAGPSKPFIRRNFGLMPGIRNRTLCPWMKSGLRRSGMNVGLGPAYTLRTKPTDCIVFATGEKPTTREKHFAKRIRLETKTRGMQNLTGWCASVR
jgi:hypothetical protein